MQSWKIILVYSILLIAVGLWGFFGPTPPNPIALLVTIFGVVFLLVLPLYRANVKLVNRILPVLIFLLVWVLLKQLIRSIENGLWWSFARFTLLLLCTMGVLYLIIPWRKIKRRIPDKYKPLALWKNRTN